jgi:hypothetical protein
MVWTLSVTFHCTFNTVSLSRGAKMSVGTVSKLFFESDVFTDVTLFRVTELLNIVW